MGTHADAVRGALDRARAAWPDLAVDEARFIEHLTGLLAKEPDPAEALDKLQVADVYLSVACADAVPGALAVLERDYLSTLRGALSRMGLSQTSIDETLQVMREELLVAPPGGRPRILGYAGRGALRGWLRAVATRTGLRTIKQPRYEELDETLHAAGGGDLELDFLRKTYGAAFRTAFRTALAALSTEERLLLKQRFRHKLTVEELGVMQGVHASTISRWVTAAREHLVAGTRAAMMKELGVGKDAVSSILRLIQSDLEITLSTTVDPT